MRQVLRLCSLLLPLCVVPMALAQMGHKEELQIGRELIREESISGRSFQAAQAASKELASKGLDILRYRIFVGEYETSWVVSFIDADVRDSVRLTVRGDPGKIPGLEVELSRDGFSVIRSNFIR
jgi:hypothetical protein